MNYDNFKSRKKQCFVPYLDDAFFEKPQVGGRGGVHFRVNHCCQYLNLQTFNQSTQSNQLFLDSLVKFSNLSVDCIDLLIYLVLFNYKFWIMYVYIYTSTITHYPFLGDLHILLFILYFFMYLTLYIYIYIYI